jgi:aldehyde dehydrogenase (NAD+)
MAAKRIVWGKFINAGQTCVAPDYLLVHKNVREELIQKIKKYCKEFYGEKPLNNQEYPKIINQKHFERLLGLMESGRVVIGGEANSTSNQIEPTVLDQVTWESSIMKEEIFGPLLPVIEYEQVKDVVRWVNNGPKPLALYYFTTSKENEQFIMNAISFGGGCINDTITHVANSNFAFGGVGESGMGSYHGKESYKTFSHRKSVLKKSNLIDIPLRYPPHKNHLSLLKRILK